MWRFFHLESNVFNLAPGIVAGQQLLKFVLVINPGGP